jgi:hypothetical protein
MVKIDKIQYTDGYQLLIIFNDGIARLVDFERFLVGPLHDINFFKTAYLDNDLVCWKNGTKFSADFLYDKGEFKDAKEFIDEVEKPKESNVNKKLNVVAICGVETIRDASGHVKKYSDTFLDNLETYKKENPIEDLVIIDARKYVNNPNPIASIWKTVASSFTVLDKFIYSGHSSTESLICFSHVRTELTVEERYFRASFDYKAPWSKDATFFIYGCQAGGTNAVKSETSIAQIIANKIERTVYAYTSKSYQKEAPKGVYHQVSDDKIGLVKFTPVSKNR